MATIATIRADLIGSSAVFRAEMIRGQQQANQSLTAIRTEVRATADSLRDLKTAVGAGLGFEGLRSGISALLEAQKTMQQIHYSLVSATGSGVAADATFQKVVKIVDQLGLPLEVSAQGFARMSAAANANNIPMSQQLALFTGLAKSSTLLHLSTQQVDSAVLAMSQMFGKGKIQAQELQLQLGQAIPGVVPRFQQAVLAMNQGTDLAGKSFQKLLEEGDLTVSRFLPALISALHQTGRGAEEAATGLNAEMNRLSSSWFKLKADLSGGLFGETATASIRFMRTNLAELADVAGVTGGLIVARLAGQGASKIASPILGGIASSADAKKAAQGVAELAAARAKDAAAAVQQTERSLALAQTWRTTAAAAIDAQRSVMAVAYANNEAAQTTLAHQATTMTLSANLRARAEAEIAAAAASARLAKAQASLDAAVASGNIAMQRQIALEAQLTRAKAADAAATEALAVANANVARLGILGSGGLLARGAASFGSFALGLVGGPWGAAIAAIGGVAYAIAQANQRSVEWKRQTDEEAKSLKALSDQLREAAVGYGSLNAAKGAQQTGELFKSANDELAKKATELAELEAKATELRKRIADAAASSAPEGAGFGAAILQRDLDRTTDRIKALTPEFESLKTQTTLLGRTIYGDLSPALDGLKSSIDRLRNGGSIGDFFSDLMKSVKDAPDIGKELDERRARIKGFADEMLSIANSAKKKLETEGKTQAQIVTGYYQKALKDAVAEPNQDVRRSLLADAASAYRAALPDAQKQDAYEAAKKGAAAVREQQQAYLNLRDAQIGEIATLKAALDGTGEVTAEQRKLNEMLAGGDSSFRRLSASQKEEAITRQREIVSLKQAVKAREDEAKAAEKQAASLDMLRENLESIAQQQSDRNADSLASMSHGGQYAQDLQEQLRLNRQFDEQLKQARRKFDRDPFSIDFEKESAEIQRAREDALRGERDYMAKRLELQQDWKVGAQRALDEYLTAAQDVASQTATMFTNGISTMEDAMANFAETGKLNFHDLATSILKDLVRMETRILASQALQWLMGSFLPGGTYGQAIPITSAGPMKSATGNVFAGGNVVPFARGGAFTNSVATAPTLAPMALFGEAGPEAIMPLSRGKDGKLGVRASGGGGGLTSNVSIVVNVDGGGSPQSHSSADGNALGAQFGNTLKVVVQEQIVREARQGGLLWRMMNGRGQ